MIPFLIVMYDKFLNGSAQRGFSGKDHPIKTLMPNRWHETLRESAWIRRPGWRPQHSIRSRHSCRTVGTKRSAKAFGFGDRAGDLNTATFAPRNKSLNGSVNSAERSWISHRAARKKPSKGSVKLHAID